MTRAEAYNEGWHDGRRWAEADIRDGLRLDPEEAHEGASDTWRARALGALRGYRDTWARFEAGEISRQTFEVTR